MKVETKRLSDKYVWITLIGFVGLIVSGTCLSFLSDEFRKDYGNFLVLIPTIFIGLFILGQIQMRRLDKIQCKRGEHNPDELQVCRDCHKHLEGSEELIDQHNRDLDKKLSKKSAIIKFIGPSLAMVIFMTIFAYWVITSTHADLINGINAINSTTPNGCLYLVKQQVYEKGANSFMFGSHVIKATNDKWLELDCIHKPIMDDLNKTCPIGVIPQYVTMKGFLCNQQENGVK